MGDNTTLAELLGLNLHECEEEVKNIVDKAVKEMSMEKILRDLDATWSKMDFEHEIHPRTQCSLLKASEELIETLEENQVCLQNLITSKFIAHFLEEVSSWQKKLMIADQVITVKWFDSLFDVSSKSIFNFGLFVFSIEKRFGSKCNVLGVIWRVFS